MFIHIFLAFLAFLDSSPRCVTFDGLKTTHLTYTYNKEKQIDGLTKNKEEHMS